MSLPGVRDENSADRVAARLRDLIVSGRLAPGQHIRQTQMADDLGVSRAPLREALKQLLSEGLVSHLHNSGYEVARLGRREFDQVYLMRRLLESEVIRTLPRLKAADLRRLEVLNQRVERAALDMNLREMQTCNHEFHFAIFRFSGLDLVITELERLWRWAMPYHIAVYYDSSGRSQTIADHQEMVEALRVGDNERVVALMDHHRGHSERHMSPFFEAY